MALPSSPPILAEEPPSSPPLLPTLTNTSFSRGSSRKRQLSDYGSLSSDPLFSEDTSETEPGEQDGQPRRKRLIKGPWWTPGKKASQSLRKNMAKREGFRNADSGVWMGSDDSTDSLRSTQSTIADAEVQDLDLSTPPKPSSTITDPGRLAAEIVTRCVDKGKERVDLSDLGLSHISDTTLEPLQQMIRHVHDDLTQPPSEDQFSPLTPSLQLYLSGNRLPSLPAEIFRLANLTVLSFRNNGLTELHPAVSRLQRLQELNIAGNQLRWLPWEILDMTLSRDEKPKLSFRPNPLLTLGLDTLNDAALETISTNLQKGRENCMELERDGIPRLGRTGREHLIFLASSTMKYFHADGSLARSAASTTKAAEVAWYKPSFEHEAAPETHVDRRPASLMELVLRTVQHEHSLAEMQAATQAELPSSIVQGLKLACEGLEFGNPRCSVCDAEFLIPRAEWLEYWFHGRIADALCEEKIIPFRRLACSWACAEPSAVGTGLV